MEFQILCGTWVKEEDEKILDVLQASDRWLTAEELAAATGVPAERAARTLRMLKQQKNAAEKRRAFFREG